VTCEGRLATKMLEVYGKFYHDERSMREEHTSGSPLSLLPL
jgi:hypothetical protein